MVVLKIWLGGNRISNHGGGGGVGDHFFGMNLLVGLKHGCILNLVEFGCVGAEKKWGSVSVWFGLIGK